MPLVDVTVKELSARPLMMAQVEFHEPMAYSS